MCNVVTAAAAAAAEVVLAVVGGCRRSGAKLHVAIAYMRARPWDRGRLGRDTGWEKMILGARQQRSVFCTLAESGVSCVFVCSRWG